MKGSHHYGDEEAHQRLTCYANYSHKCYSDIMKTHQSELLTLCKSNTEAGIWQYHQAASVIKTLIKAVFPDKYGPWVVRDFNCVVYPLGHFSNTKIVYIMMTPTRYTGRQLPNHFVPLLFRG